MLKSACFVIMLYEFDNRYKNVTSCVMDVFTNYEDAKEYMIAQANSICENKPGVEPAVVLEGQRLIVKSRWDGGFMDMRAMPRELFQHIREEK